MKSYLRFLGRNKLYTAIEVVGLSLALAFVIVLGSYVLEDLNCDRSSEDVDEVYVMRNMNHMEEFFVRHDLSEEMVSSIPGIKSVTQIIFEEDDLGGQTFAAEYLGQEHYFTSLLAVQDDFFSFFSFRCLGIESSKRLCHRNCTPNWCTIGVFGVQIHRESSQNPCPARLYLSRVFMVGNSSTSLIAWLSVSSMVMRSMPKPMPPVGGMPSSRA